MVLIGTSIARDVDVVAAFQIISFDEAPTGIVSDAGLMLGLPKKRFPLRRTGLRQAVGMARRCRSGSVGETALQASQIQQAA
jgi:hypothetical protein